MNVENKPILVNCDKEKQELKALIIEQIFYQKYSAANYEIPENLFNLIKMIHMGIAFTFAFLIIYKINQDSHISIRESVFDYIKANKVYF